MDKVEKILAFNIVKFREGLGWSQDDLAEKANLSKNTVANYERCERWPELNKLVALADALKVSTSKLFMDPEKSTEPTRTEALSKICKELGFKSPVPIKKKRLGKTILTEGMEINDD